MTMNDQSDCKDSTRPFLWKGDKYKSCTFVGNNKNRCSQGGNNPASTHCPKTCKECGNTNNGCIDSKRRFRLKKNSALKSCDWVKKNKGARCKMIGDNYTCRATCTDCSGSGGGNGEEECEGKGFNRAQCNAVGCCEFGGGKCWSAVGTNPCYDDKPSDDEPSDDNPSDDNDDDNGDLYGGCHITKECNNCVKSPLKSISEVKPLPSAGNNIKAKMVYGLNLIGKAPKDYVYWCWIVKVITEMFSDNVIDKNLQEDVIKNLYKRKVIAEISEGSPIQFKNGFEESNSICDIIGVKMKTQKASRQLSEVLEHVLHFIHVGERYIFSQWSTKSVTSTAAWEAVQEAVDKGVYDISQYQEMDEGEEAKQRIILQEFHFWLVYCDWNLFNEFNLELAEWKGVKTLKEMKKKLPKTHQLYTQTTQKILKKPTTQTLRSLGKLRKNSKPDTCVMPTS